MEPNQVSGTEDEAAHSRKLFAAMETAGFRQSNARVQSGLALAMEAMLRIGLRTDKAFIFGSFSDGWGSSLSRIDGRIDDESDIDISIFLPVPALHVKSESSCRDCRDCCRLDYFDGHVATGHGVSAPNINIPKTEIAVAIDLITVLPCCSYPRIELLQPGYGTHMPQRIMQLLREEALGDSPRCHAVAASPPDQQSCMRVSTTLLERAVMHNLSSVQGQFFILVKFLVKKVIGNQVTGLKTYIAKNLLFYMLDETPAGDWKPENLVALLRQSLQMLIAMMKSLKSENVCMKHFFLRDANVYLKASHDTKEKIIVVLTNVADHLTEVICEFLSSLPETEVRSIEFFVLLPVIREFEVLSSSIEDQDNEAYEKSKVVNRLLFSDSQVTLEKLLESIDRIPDCARNFKRLLRAMAYKKFHESPDEADVICGIPCPSEDTDWTVEQTVSLALDYLERAAVLDFKLTPQFPRSIVSFPPMEDLLAGFPSVLQLCCSETGAGGCPKVCRPHTAAIIVALLIPSPLFQRLLTKGSPSFLARLANRSDDFQEHIKKLLPRTQPSPEPQEFIKLTEIGTADMIAQQISLLAVLICFLRVTSFLQSIDLQLEIVKCLVTRKSND